MGKSRFRTRCFIAAALTVAVVGVWPVAYPTHPIAGSPALPRAGTEGRMVSVGGMGVTAHLLPPAVPKALFNYSVTEAAEALNALLPAPAAQIHDVRVDRSLGTGKTSPFWQQAGLGRVAIPLPAGGALTVRIDDSEMLGPDRFVSHGRIEGRPMSRATFAWNDGFLHASVEDPGGAGAFVLRVATSELSQIYRVDPAMVAPCGGPRVPPFAPPDPSRAAYASGPARTTRPVAAGLPLTGPEVHVMMLYTGAVLPTMTGPSRASALQSAFDLAVAGVNRTFEASAITARLKLVGIAETVYDESTSEPARVQDDALDALYLPADGKMDEIHALRDAYGADLVCLAVDRFDPRSSGLSFVLSAPGDDDSPRNERFAFGIVHYGAIAGTNVLAHEMGHLFGCAHDRQNAEDRPGKSYAGAFPFSYGYRFFGQDGRQYRDIMAYPPGMEVGYFSNPDIVLPAPIHAPVGIAAGRPGEADAARTISENAFQTASYRLQVAAPVAGGELINVATRAYVGAGDQVLIGGLVIAGDSPQPVLLRAAGPSLAPFGVRNPLADPVLTLFRDGHLVASNDHWMAPAANAPGGAEVGHLATSLGAFPFLPDSTDAALLVTLSPGVYSAMMTGGRGSTGIGLLEAYQVTGTELRIINVGTRAFVDRAGREMVSGFVVNAAPGHTKRVLVRVLGPTLARAPFQLPSVLHDPEMELHDAQGRRILVSDDWSSDATGGASETNDFSPVVIRHAERQLFATGLAPRNRREPAVLLELAAGAYTLTVRPYERRDPDPSLDQPAQPGIAVVEIYEINR